MMLDQITVLDKGFVQLIDTMPHPLTGRTGDTAIAEAARVSYGATSKGPDADARLIVRLAHDKHTSPFEHVTFTFRVKAPLFVARQWFRHRTWSYSEISRRYTELKDDEDYYTPAAWRKQSMVNKQGSEGELTGVYADGAEGAYRVAVKGAMGAYRVLLTQGVSRELARMVLPQSMYTVFVATVDLHNLAHFVRLRVAPDAQWEMQQYARALWGMASKIAPVACAALIPPENP